MNEAENSIPGGFAFVCPGCGGAWRLTQIIGEPFAEMKQGPWRLIGFQFFSSGPEAALGGVYERANFANGVMEQSFGDLLRANDPTTGAYDSGVEFACDIMARLVWRVRPPKG